MSDQAKEVARQLAGARDLYTALHRAMGALPPAIDSPDLGHIRAALAGLDADAEARLGSVDQGLLRAIMRHGRGMSATAAEPAVRDYLATQEPFPMFRPGLTDSATMALPTDGSLAGMPAFSDRCFDDWFAGQSDGRLLYGIGLYGEHRTVYATDQFADAASPERRTRHLGIDVFAPAGTAVYAPLAGRVRQVTYNADPLDYGHTLILDHDADGTTFHSLYGHLGATLPGLVQPGDRVAPGQLIAHLGDWHENGGWAPHLHYQIMTDMLDQDEGNFFGVGHDSLWPVWQAICIDPNLVLRLPPTAFLPG